MRVRSIDLFRGLAIALMVFFTVTYWMSAWIPDFLKHNEPGSLHIGDFVLPMFLFASGMSLVFFKEKRGRRKDYWLDIIERFGKLVLISVILSVFSSGVPLGMDEVMLSALLFIVTVVLMELPEAVMIVVSVALPIVYIILMSMRSLPDFSLAYLGGYPVVPFYLPVMLAGVMIGRRIEPERDDRGIALILSAAIAAFIVLALMVPPYKMEASPSFMALSIAVSIILFEAVKGIRDERLEYIGKRPIRYWVTMFVLVLIPLALVAFTKNLALPLQIFSAWEAVLAAIVCIPLLYLVSKALDRISWLAI